jgi:hypothetical protein
MRRIMQRIAAFRFVFNTIQTESGGLHNRFGLQNLFRRVQPRVNVISPSSLKSFTFKSLRPPPFRLEIANEQRNRSSRSPKSFRIKGVQGPPHDRRELRHHDQENKQLTPKDRHLKTPVSSRSYTNDYTALSRALNVRFFFAFRVSFAMTAQLEVS